MPARTIKKPAAHDLPQRNIDSVMRLEAHATQRRTITELFADSVTAAAGSAPFIILHALWFGAWIIVNHGLIPGVKAFDPFPYSFLTLVVSLEAIFLTLLVLMSQKRMMRDADKRAHLDLQVNMLAEQESTETLRLVQAISKHLCVEEKAAPVQKPQEPRTEELAETTHVDQLAEKIDTSMPQ
jgi:uncharacterized membrane protein